MPRGDHHQAVINTVGVESIEQALADVREAGGQVLMDPPDEIPGVGLFAYARDSEGNTFGVLQPAPSRALSAGRRTRFRGPLTWVSPPTRSWLVDRQRSSEKELDLGHVGSALDVA